MTFSLCHATARPPEVWAKAAATWHERCDSPDQVEYVLVAKQGLSSFPRLPDFGQSVMISVPESKGGISQWNLAAELSVNEVLIQMADDFLPPDHWDTELAKVLPGVKGPFVVDVDNQDASYPLIPHAIMTRPYYAKFGYIGHPDYYHLMADVEFSQLARKSGVVIDARHLKFEHLTPDRGAEWDEVYKAFRGNSDFYKREQEVFTKRRSAGFPKYSVLEG
jgi:hypothetical protein